MSQATQLDLKQLIAMQRQVADLAVRRKQIRSSMSGSHISRIRGRGMEFDEVRVYQPGDDVGSIDWKVTARKATTHIKLFREERERPVLICLDYRKSMFFATRGSLKSVQATKAAALLAWHGIQHGDRLGGLLFSDSEHFELKPKRGRMGVLQFLHRCCHAKAWQKEQLAAEHKHDFSATTRRLRQVSKPGSLIYLLSDFRGLDKQAVSDLIQLARHNDVVLISVYDKLEREFPQSGNYPVFDGKDFFTLSANRSLQHKLKQQQEHHLSMLQTLQAQHGIHHLELATDDDVTLTLRHLLWAK